MVGNVFNFSGSASGRYSQTFYRVRISIYFDLDLNLLGDIASVAHGMGVWSDKGLG